MPDLKELLGVTPLIAFFLIAAWVVWKILPNWKAVKLAEISVRKQEAEAKIAETKVRERSSSGGPIERPYR